MPVTATTVELLKRLYHWLSQLTRNDEITEFWNFHVEVLDYIFDNRVGLGDHSSVVPENC